MFWIVNWMIFFCPKNSQLAKLVGWLAAPRRGRPRTVHETGLSVRGGERVDKKDSSAESRVQQRIKRLERVCAVLSISVLLLGVIGVCMALDFRKVVDVLVSVTDGVDYIRQQMDAIAKIVQNRF